MDKATTERLIRHAWKYGHFRNPDYPDTQEVTDSNVDTLVVTDELARQAIASVQKSDYNINILCDIHHGRELAIDDDDKADGDPGPATIAYLDIQRCQVPDFACEAGSFGMATSGGWLQCDPDQEHDHEVVIKFDDRNAPTKWRGYMDVVKQNAIEISRDMGLAPRYISWDSDEDYQSSVIFRFISGGVIGFYYLPQGSGCRRVPQGALDTSFLPDVEVASGLWIHEGLGHGIGLQHRPARRIEGVLRGIMNPSILRVPLSWRGDPSEGDMRKLYGGETLVPVEPPTPPPVPVPPRETWTILDGDIKIKFGDHVNTFRLIESSGA